MSCLFNSLSYFLNIPSSTIRQTICNYLEENKPLFDDLYTNVVIGLDSLPDNYIQNMRRESTWGGAIEIKAACIIWNLNVTVHNTRDGNAKRIVFRPLNLHDATTKDITLEWSGGHYSPVH